MPTKYTDPIPSGQTIWVESTFLDKDAAPEAPATVKYRVINPDTEAEILEEQTFPIPAQTIEIEIDSVTNTVAATALRNREARRLIVVGEYGVGDAVVSWFDYTLIAPE